MAMGIDDIEDDEVDEIPTAAAHPEAPGGIVEPGEAAPDIAPTPAPNPLHPEVQSYLSKLQAAQEQQKQNQIAGGLTSALVQLGHGISRAPGQADLSGAQAVALAAGDPVKALQQQEAAKQTQFKLDKASKESDPNSEESKQVRAIYKPLLAKSNLPADALDNMGAAQIKAYVQGPAALQAKMQAQMDAKEVQNQARQDKKEAKATEDQAKAYQRLTHDLNSFRGNKVAQNAAEALRNSDSAMALINSKQDPNTFTNQQNSLLAAEISKIANGGAATEGSTHDAKANTLQSKAADFWQSVSGNPTGAQLGEFIKQNKEYLEHLNDVNHKYVDDYRRGILKGYKRLVHPDDYADAESEYLSQRAPGEGGQGPEKQKAAFPPDVTAYAEKHGITPEQAAAIKAQRTGGH